MSTKTYARIKREIKEELLQEFVVPILRDAKDPEGEYKPAFVRRVLMAAKEKPIYTYNSETFLRQISGKK